SSDLYRKTLCPVCSGILDIIPFTKPDEAKIVDSISAYMNMKYLSSKTDYVGGSNEESWADLEQSLTSAY
ncbi:MAG TPA: hypothetical protein VF220_02720, partial [Nitrososphaeraceae archaeon]